MCKNKAAADMIAEIDARAEKLKKEIMECKSKVAVSGKSYYVSEKNGDDLNDGLSPQKPWKTLKNANNGPATCGDGIFFERGGIYRGTVNCRSGVTYAAYGDGEKPKMYGSPENGADPSKWRLLSGTENIWVYNSEMRDIGLIVFNEGERHSVKKIPSYINGKYVKRFEHDTEFNVRKHLDKNLTHFCEQDKVLTKNGLPDLAAPENKATLYLRCDEGNPGEVFDSIEFSPRYHVMNIGSCRDVHIDNLSIMYGGNHGVGAATCKGLHVTNCYFGWIGGCIQFYAADGRVVRFGNSIEIYGGCDDYVCDHNYIYQAYDAGMTHQVGGGESDFRQKNICYTNNLVEYCTYSLEYFLGKPSSVNSLRYQRNILVKGNIFRYAGFGFGEQRPEFDCPAAHVKGWDSHNPLDENYIYEDNIFDRSRNMMVHIGAGKKHWLPKFKNNIFVQYKDGDESTFGRYGENPTKLFSYDENIIENIETPDFNENGSFYYASKDELYDLPDFMPKNERD